MLMELGSILEFQSTRPVRGATLYGREAARDTTYFNPRAPCGARLLRIAEDGIIDEFQSTRPVRGASELS